MAAAARGSARAKGEGLQRPDRARRPSARARLDDGNSISTSLTLGVGSPSCSRGLRGSLRLGSSSGLDSSSFSASSLSASSLRSSLGSSSLGSCGLRSCGLRSGGLPSSGLGSGGLGSGGVRSSGLRSSSLRSISTRSSLSSGLAVLSAANLAAKLAGAAVPAVVVYGKIGEGWWWRLVVVKIGGD